MILRRQQRVHNLPKVNSVTLCRHRTHCDRIGQGSLTADTDYFGEAIDEREWNFRDRKRERENSPKTSSIQQSEVRLPVTGQYDEKVQQLRESPTAGDEKLGVPIRIFNCGIASVFSCFSQGPSLCCKLMSPKLPVVAALQIHQCGKVRQWVINGVCAWDKEQMPIPVQIRITAKVVVETVFSNPEHNFQKDAVLAVTYIGGHDNPIACERFPVVERTNSEEICVIHTAVLALRLSTLVAVQKPYRRHGDMDHLALLLFLSQVPVCHC